MCPVAQGTPKRARASDTLLHCYTPASSPERRKASANPSRALFYPHVTSKFPYGPTARSKAPMSASARFRVQRHSTLVSRGRAGGDTGPAPDFPERGHVSALARRCS